MYMRCHYRDMHRGLCMIMRGTCLFIWHHIMISEESMEIEEITWRWTLESCIEEAKVVLGRLCQRD